jgi:hypothetical protein
MNVKQEHHHSLILLLPKPTVTLEWKKCKPKRLVRRAQAARIDQAVAEFSALHAQNFSFYKYFLAIPYFSYSLLIHDLLRSLCVGIMPNEMHQPHIGAEADRTSR